MTGIARKIELSDTERKTLLKWKRSPNTSQKLVRRADIIIAAADGLSNKQISEKPAISISAVKIQNSYSRNSNIQTARDRVFYNSASR